MKFETVEDVLAPIEFVFEQISDFAAFERAAKRSGAEVRRLDERAVVGSWQGMIWETKFRLRGKKRDVVIELIKFEPPNRMVAKSHSDALNGYTVIDLIPLSRNRTRVTSQISVEARNLSAKLLMQSVKLARGRITRHLKERSGAFAKTIEERYQQRRR